MLSVWLSSLATLTPLCRHGASWSNTMSRQLALVGSVGGHIGRRCEIQLNLPPKLPFKLQFKL